MFCTKCGKELKDNCKECPNCGQKVDAKYTSAKETINSESKNENSNNGGGNGKAVAFIVSVIIGIVLIKANHPIVGGAFIVEGILALTSFKWLKKIVIEAIAVVIICLFVRNGNDDTIKVSNEYTDETEGELNMPDQNQIEYDEEDTNNMMWPDLEYYSVVTDNYASAYTTIETPEAEEFFANEDNLWYKAEDEYSAREWCTHDPDDFRYVTVEPCPIDRARTMQIGLEAKDGFKITMEFNPLPAKIGPNGELIYYLDLSNHYICFTYFPEDGHLHIEDSAYDFDGDYY